MADIQKRFDRILAIYMLLQSKPVVTAAELSNRYEVSVRTIYRDIQSLMQAGVPIYGEAGSGYALIDGYKMPPIRFTAGEALSFITAEKLVEKYTDKQIVNDFSTALYKMKAVLRGDEKEKVAIGQDKVLIRNGSSPFNEKISNGIQLLIENMVAKKCVEIQYQKAGAPEIDERTIEPIGIFVDNRFWYCMAYCHLRADYRQFRLDRMQEINTVALPFTKEHRDLNYYLELSAQKQVALNVVLQVDKSIVRFLEWEQDYFGFTHQIVQDDYVEKYFSCTVSHEGFARWFMMFADKAKIIKPKILEDKVKELFDSAMKRLT